MLPLPWPDSATSLPQLRNGPNVLQVRAFGGRVPLDEILQELKNTWKQVQVPGFDPGGDEQRHEPQRYLPSAAGSSRNESTVHDQVCASHVG